MRTSEKQQSPISLHLHVSNGAPLEQRKSKAEIQPPHCSCCSGACGVAERLVASLGRWLICFAAFFFAAHAFAESVSFPSGPVRIIVGSSAGGGGDLTARTLAKFLSDQWKVPVVVENRPGAGGILSSAYVAKAKADGTVLELRASNFTTLAVYSTNLPFDPIKDFAPISLVAKSPVVLTATTSLGAKNLQALIQLARAKPGQLNFGSGGAGTLTHFLIAQFNELAKVDIRHIPYQGAAPMVVGQVGGQVDLTFVALASSASLLATGKVQALGLVGRDRSTLSPDIPTLAELGLPGMDAAFWYGLVAPAGTPKSIVSKIQNDIAFVLHRPDVRDLFLSQGNEPQGSTSQEFDTLLRQETSLWRELVKTGRVEVEK